MSPAMTDPRSPLSRAAFALLFSLACGLGACQFDSAISDLRCETNDDCPTGSVCTQGYCSSDESELGSQVVTVEVSPRTVTMGIGDTTTLTATARSADGEVVEDATIEWSSSSSQIIGVDEEGNLTARSLGSALVTAKSELGEGSAAINVTPEVIGSVEISPDPAVVEQGSTLALNADVLTPNGEPLENRPVQWSIADSSIATVDSTGVLRGMTTGMTTVEAEAGGNIASATVEVTPAEAVDITLLPSSAVIEVGEIFSINALLRDASGRLIEDQSPTWTSDDDSIAAVNDNGEVEGISPGSTVIRATAGSAEATVNIDVQPVEVATLDVSPAAASLQVGSTLTLDASAFSSGGNELTGRNITWSSSDDAIATVSNDGEVDAVAVGTALISANIGNLQASAAINVIPARAESVSVSPDSVDIMVGGTTSLSVEALDSDDDVISDPEVTWTSDDASIAAVSEDGTVVARSVGSATITASVDGETATATVNIIERAVDNVQIIPGSATITVAGALDLRVEARASDGTLLEGRSISWSSADDSVASVDNNGTVTGASAGGPVEISATVDGVTGTADITVEPRPVAWVEVEPRPARVRALETLQLNATPRAPDGTELTGRTISWSSTDATIATVDSSGVVSGVQEGLVVIEADVEGTIGYASVRVGPAAVDEVIISPTDPTIDIGESLTLDATAEDSADNPLSGRTIQWSSDDTAVATVDGSGVIVGTGAGSANITATIDGVSSTTSVTVSWRFSSVSSSWEFACAVSTNDNAYCWGDGSEGQLGDGTTTDRNTATRVSGPDDIVRVWSGYDHTCGLNKSGEAFCWGDNEGGQLGDDSVTDSRLAVAVEGANTYQMLAAGANFTCGLSSNDTVDCWGDGRQGQLGDGNSGGGTLSSTPVEVQLDYNNWQPTKVVAGLAHACVMVVSTSDSSDVRVFCWGDNDEGQLGDNSNSDRDTPVEIDHDFSSDTAMSLAAGGNFSCMSVEDDTNTLVSYCWGSNSEGQLGIGDTNDHNDPREVDGSFEFINIWAGIDHACGLLTDGSAKCWGDNTSGQLGNGSTGGRETSPVDVSGSTIFDSMNLGRNFSCGIASDDQLYCWGNDGRGRLGTGGSGDTNTPTAIAEP